MKRNLNVISQISRTILFLTLKRIYDVKLRLAKTWFARTATERHNCVIRDYVTSCRNWPLRKAFRLLLWLTARGSKSGRQDRWWSSGEIIAVERSKRWKHRFSLFLLPFLSVSRGRRNAANSDCLVSKHLRFVLAVASCLLDSRSVFRPNETEAKRQCSSDEVTSWRGPRPRPRD